ncbi:MAG: DsbE family thiol:disulfide interchange protein [Pseudomonadota bacterium]
MKPLLLLPLLLFLALGALLFTGMDENRDPSLVPSPLISKPAPDFDLPLLGNPSERLTRSDLLGQQYFLNVWGSWCPGCQTEHNFIAALADRGPLPVYGLNWKDDATQALAWLEHFGNPYAANLYDPEGDVAIDFGVYGAPETFLINADGTIAAKFIGPLYEQAYQETFAHLVQDPVGK